MIIRRKQSGGVILYTLKSAGHERGMVAHEDSFILNHINKKEKTPLKAFYLIGSPNF
jgi:hypothetical protein